MDSCKGCDKNVELINYNGDQHNCKRTSGLWIPRFIMERNIVKLFCKLIWKHYVPWGRLRVVAQRRDIDWHKTYLDQEKIQSPAEMTQCEDAAIMYWLSQSEDKHLNGRAIPTTQYDLLRFK